GAAAEGADDASRALAVARFARVIREVAERERHLAVGQEREDRREIGDAGVGRGLRAKRRCALVPEMLDRPVRSARAPAEERAIAAQSILGERGGDCERLIAQEASDAWIAVAAGCIRRRVEPVHDAARRRRLAELGAEPEV